MNCNIYLNNDLYIALENYRKAHHKSRNSIITEALKGWLNIHKDKHWSKSFFDFSDDMKNLYPDISELRKDVVSPKDIKF